MATAHRNHPAHPLHLLLKTWYDSKSSHVCDLCATKLAGMVGYRCNSCDFDIHEACADYFQATMSFFAHPWHTLTLAPIADNQIGWSCDICREACPPGSFVYRCVQCGFDVHPLCTMVPEKVRSPLHEHDLVMVASSGTCSACQDNCPVWFYRCGYCLVNLHIECLSGAQSSSGQNEVVGPSRTTRIAKFLLKKSLRFAYSAATGGRASTVLAVLGASLGNS